MEAAKSGEALRHAAPRVRRGAETRKLATGTAPVFLAPLPRPRTVRACRPPEMSTTVQTPEHQTPRRRRPRTDQEAIFGVWGRSHTSRCRLIHLKGPAGLPRPHLQLSVSLLLGPVARRSHERCSRITSATPARCGSAAACCGPAHCDCDCDCDWLCRLFDNGNQAGRCWPLAVPRMR